MFSTFFSFAVNTRLPENRHQAVRFHLQVLNQLNEKTCSVWLEKPTGCNTLTRQWWGAYLPDCVELGSLRHGVLPRFVLEDLIVVDCFPIHHGQSKSTRLLSVSHPDAHTKTSVVYNRSPLNFQSIVCQRLDDIKSRNALVMRLFYHITVNQWVLNC